MSKNRRRRSIPKAYAGYPEAISLGIEARRRKLKAITKILQTLLVIIAIVMVVVGLMQIIFRYGLKTSLAWSDELLRYLFFWSTFIGVPLGLLSGSHAAIDLIPNKLKGRTKFIYNTFIKFVMLCAFGFFTYYGLNYAILNLSQYSPGLRLPMFFVIISIGLGGLCSTLYTIQMIYNDIKGYGETDRKGGAA
jgi:TRAP-type C4-dicarboxylate transport system permease small subunit